MEKTELIQKFIKDYGQSDSELMTNLTEGGFEIDDKDDGFNVELAINLGYVWLESYDVWIAKENIETPEDIELFNELKN